jgi:hypothetical protein
MKTLSEFTNLYELSKTLRFELRPIGETEKMLEKNEVFRKDEIRKQKYEETKPFFNKLHQEFIQEALSGSSLVGLDEYYTLLIKWQNEKEKEAKNKIQKELKEKEKDLRKGVVDSFNKKAEQWQKEYSENGLKLKNKNIEILFEEAVFNLLAERYKDQEGVILEITKKDKKGEDIKDENGKLLKEKVSIFSDWKRFVGYFTKFQETRKNLYKDDGTSTAIATRIIDQNLRRFCGNLTIFEKIKNKIDFAEVEKDFKESMINVFSLGFYNQCLLQGGIDFYNKIIGGETLQSGEKKRGLNELINEYRQKNKGEKLPFLVLLDKQILGEKEKDNFRKEIQDKEELHQVLQGFSQKADERVEALGRLFENFTEKNTEFNLSETYISKEAFNTISLRWTGETEKFKKYLFEIINQKEVRDWYDLFRLNNKDPKIKKDGEEYKFPNLIALQHIKEALESISAEERSKFWKEKYYLNKEDVTSEGFLIDIEPIWEQFLKILKQEFDWLLERKANVCVDKNKNFNEEAGKIKKFENILSVNEKNRTATVTTGYNVFKEKLKELLAEKAEFAVSPDSKIIIKNFADSALFIYQMAKYFAVEKKRAWNPMNFELGDFYNNPDFGYKVKFYNDAYEDIVQNYNLLRNYLTKKPYSEEKWKLNFENATLCGGWDKNKESDNSAVVLRKDGRYYLGLMKKGCNKLFANKNKKEFIDGIENGKYEKMIYKYFPDQAKMFPKVCFSAKRLELFQPSDEIFNIYKKAEFKKGETFSLQSMRKLIDFYKDCLGKYEGWKCYNFINLKPTKNYDENIGKFFTDVATNGYKVSFQEISESYINEKNKNGELYLFEIHNKDWNLKDGKEKTGSKNIHTLYFESLFSEENASQNFPVKLNGQAEIFFRPKTEEGKLEKKEDRKGKKVIDRKRYSKDKILFHCPISLNRGKKDSYRFNSKINNFLANNSDINIIGIDRGEKHLAYYSVINQNGEIIESNSLNSVNGINYGEKLEKKAKDREQARKDWQEVEGIKNLKKGYISQVVRTLVDLAIKYNAIIVFEDLNMRFKQIRGGIEKSVYQQLEKALIDKLSFLVNKGEGDSQKAGHLTKAYQLTAPFTSFKEMGKQTGIIFYTQASYTSKIDPVTGWRPNWYLKYANAQKTSEEILKFSQIEFNQEENRFEFSYDLAEIFKEQKLKNKEIKLPGKTKWTLCSCVERFRWDRRLNSNQGDYEHYPVSGEGSITDRIKKLFDSVGINHEKDNLKEKIRGIDSNKKENAGFFKEFIFLFNLICQIRNTQREKSGDENDFIFSPVEKKGRLFDSRKASEFGANLPKNGDDNGAYNIARKGICILNKISQFHSANDSCDKMTWNDLSISHSEWDNFAQR